MPASLVRWAAEELALAGVPAEDLAAETGAACYAPEYQETLEL
jgi:hypothetical protein